MIFQHIYFGLIPFAGFVVPFKGKKEEKYAMKHNINLI